MLVGRRFGMKLLAERVRWEMTLRGGAEDFKVNNSYISYCGRKLIEDDPRLAAHIKCRVTPAADKPARASVIASEVNPLTGARPARQRGKQSTPTLLLPEWGRVAANFFSEANQ